MCRWLAYTGNSLPIEEVLFNTEHSLIDQSMSAKLAPNPTNGDGFGIGWYGARAFPGLFKEIQPAWNNANLQDLAAQVESPLFLAHVRAATGTAVQRTNCHPFRYGKWLFMHNGQIHGYQKIRRDLVVAVSQNLFSQIRGSTDSELMFFLALTFGMEHDVIAGIERMVGFIEHVGRKAGIDNPIQMTLGISDGEKLYGFRYSSSNESNTLFVSRTVEALREIHPEADQLSDDAIAIVSEPLTNLSGIWQEISESSVVISGAGGRRVRDFSPRRVGST